MHRRLLIHCARATVKGFGAILAESDSLDGYDKGRWRQLYSIATQHQSLIPALVLAIAGRDFDVVNAGEMLEIESKQCISYKTF